MVNDFALRCRSLRKSFGRTEALDGLDIDLERSHTLALLGPSGCGKTTALRIIAGFDAPDSGSVEIAGRMVAGPGVLVPPEKRRVGLVFQDYVLFPHMTVARNVSYGLPKGRPRERLAALLQLVGLTGLESRYPHQLSGGQQQRVALARTLASEPEVLLLDEPFSNLDVKLRVQVREEVKRVIQAAGTTTVFVTHDQEEAFSLADTIIVMQSGRVEQVGSAEDLYYRPANRFVAGFVGTANFLPVTSTPGFIECELGRFPQSNGAAPEQAEMLVRPEYITVGSGGAEARVIAREFRGPEVLYIMRLASGREVKTIQPAEVGLTPGESVWLSLREHQPVLFGTEDDVEVAPD
jgi:iron(III) transport system ATP-binding protein